MVSNNIPQVKLGIIAVSRDCFPIALSTQRRENIVKEYKGEIFNCQTTVENEKDMLKVGYGAMVLESLLAVIALCVAGAAASANGTPADGTPFQVFSSGVAGFFEMFGIPVYVAQCFMTMYKFGCRSANWPNELSGIVQC